MDRHNDIITSHLPLAMWAANNWARARGGAALNRLDDVQQEASLVLIATVRRYLSGAAMPCALSTAIVNRVRWHLYRWLSNEIRSGKPLTNTYADVVDPSSMDFEIVADISRRLRRDSISWINGATTKSLAARAGVSYGAKHNEIMRDIKSATLKAAQGKD